MKIYFKVGFLKLILTAFYLLNQNWLSADIFESDIVIYGGTSSAVVSAVQAKRMGKSVVIVSPSRRLGGLSSNGLGWSDTGKKEVIGGIAREFYHRVWRHYQSPDAWRWQKLEDYGNRGQGSPAIDGDRRTMWVFEPKVAEQIFESWITENEIKVFRDEWLDRQNGVEMKSGKIVSMTSMSGNRYEAKVFIDCTYEGDLMAAAGISYTVGREGNDRYGETLNGVQIAAAQKNQFVNRIDPFKVPGDPASGLLQGISRWKPEIDGTGDDKIQAYNFRLCLTQVEENRVPFAQPSSYDPSKYELLLRTLNRGSRHVFSQFDIIPNAKTDTNNYGSFSTDNIGMNYRYPEGTYKERAEIISEHENYLKGYFYFLCNDPRVPQEIRDEMNQWGLARDEFEDNGHWPEQINIREARRMIGKFIMTEHEVTGRKKTLRVVGMGSYAMDSHNVQRYVAKDENGKSYVLNEGDFQVEVKKPCKIPYDSLLPQKKECENLLVTICLSASHVAFGSVRREPVFMILGQSAATAAALAIDGDIPLQDLPYDQLCKRLLADGQVLKSKIQNRKNKGVGIPPNTLSGVVVDGTTVEFEGEWTESSSLRPFVGESYYHDGNGGKGLRKAMFPFVAPKDGLHEIKVSYSSFGNRAGNLKYEVKHDEGIAKILVDQRKPQEIGDLWFSLGSFNFTKGEQYFVCLSNENTEGYVIADAIQVIGLTSPLEN